MNKYEKLREDLAKAAEKAKAAANQVDDGGTCCFDGAALRLPRWKEEEVKIAAKLAGCVCFKWTLFGQTRYVFSTNVHGQARKVEKAAEAMTEELKRRGYDAFNYCEMD